jgi:hypothetical protein
VGRLENIIERETERKKLTSRRVVLFAVFAMTVIVIILMQCTNLGMPKPLTVPAPVPPVPHHKADHVDGVWLRH